MARFYVLLEKDDPEGKTSITVNATSAQEAAQKARNETGQDVIDVIDAEEDRSDG